MVRDRRGLVAGTRTLVLSQLYLAELRMAFLRVERAPMPAAVRRKGHSRASKAELLLP